MGSMGEMDKIFDGCLLKIYYRIILGYNVEFLVFREWFCRLIWCFDIIYVILGFIWAFIVV